MRNHSYLGPVVVMLLAVFTVMGQQSSSEDHIKAVLIPRDVGLITVVSQPDCPLQFENVRFLAGVEGGGLTSYDLRNRGNKAIRSFKVGDSTGSTFTWDPKGDNRPGPIAPGQLVPWGEDSKEIVPLTDELRDKLKLKGPIQGELALMVIHVEFVDRTSYDDETVYKAMKKYMDDLQSKLYRLARLEHQGK
jgi:hypothetical protein